MRISSDRVHLHGRFAVAHTRASIRISRITQHEVLGRCPRASWHLRKSDSQERQPSGQNWNGAMFWSQIACRKRRSGERSTTLPRRFRKAPFVRHAPGRRPVVNVVTLAALASSSFFLPANSDAIRHSFASGPAVWALDTRKGPTKEPTR